MERPRVGRYFPEPGARDSETMKEPGTGGAELRTCTAEPVAEPERGETRNADRKRRV